MKKWLSPAFEFFVFALIFLIYVLFLPSTVQTGDTGELVAAAANKLVPHPPGYPLWTWLMHVWIKIFPVGTIFFKASLLNSIFAVATLWFLFLGLGRGIVSLATVACLAFTGIFWKYAELPDVFSLHLLFVAILLWLVAKPQEFQFGNWKISSLDLVPFVFLLGLTNHHTLVFMAPVTLFAFWNRRKEKSFYLFSVLGLGVFTALYSSIFLLQTEHPYSWGHLRSLRDLINHMLRTDYGTLQLGSKGSEGSAASVYLFFLKNLMLPLGPVLLIFGVSAALSAFKKKQLPSLAGLAVFLSFALYVGIFLSMINFQPVAFGREVIERFFLYPVVLAFFLIVFFSKNYLESREWQHGLAALLAALAILSFSKYFDQNNFSRNTIVEDYAINVLNAIPTSKPTLVLSDSDTKIFALRYVQEIIQPYPSIFVTEGSLLSHSWMVEKVQKTIPEFQFNPEILKTENTIRVEEDIVVPNSPQVQIVYFSGRFKSEKFKMTFLKIGRLVEVGQGQEFLERPGQLLFRSKVDVIKTELSEYDPFRQMFSEYSHYLMAKGLFHYGQKEQEVAFKYFEEALELVPYSVPSLQNFCLLKGKYANEDVRCRQLSKLEVYRY